MRTSLNPRALIYGESVLNQLPPALPFLLELLIFKSQTLVTVAPLYMKRLKKKQTQKSIYDLTDDEQGSDSQSSAVVVA